MESKAGQVFGLRATPQLEEKMAALKERLGTSNASEVMRRSLEFYYAILVEADSIKITKDGQESRIFPK